MLGEMLEVVDAVGNVLCVRPRSEVHGDPSLMHRVVHVLVLNRAGEILLQRRSMSKDVAPGRWDTSVGGHIAPGESLKDAALREMAEELGIKSKGFKFLYSYIHSNLYETELVHSFTLVHEGPFTHQEDEIDELRFWSAGDIKSALGKGVLSDNFEHEFGQFMGRE